MTTDRQRRAVRFCEEKLGIKYQGNIDDYTNVSNFLKTHLNTAKSSYTKIVLWNKEKEAVKSPILEDAVKIADNCDNDKMWYND